MFAELIMGNLELIDEEDSEGAVKLIFRVKNEERWLRTLSPLLVDYAENDVAFGISFRKEYFAKEQVDGRYQPAFCWVLLVWGELEAAVAFLTPFLVKKTKPAPPIKFDVVNPSKVTTLRRSVSGGETGLSVVKTTVPLPHVSGVRNMPEGRKGATKTLSDAHSGSPRHTYAYVEGVGD